MNASGSPFDDRSQAAVEMRERGASWREIASAFGVSKTTARRLVDPEFAERMRVMSREAKRRASGVCERCGGPTRYNGNRSRVSQRCNACNIEVSAQRQRDAVGTGSVNSRVLAILGDGGEHRFTELCRAVGKDPRRVGFLFSRLLRHGLIERTRRGYYRKVTA